MMGTMGVLIGLLGAFAEVGDLLVRACLAVLKAVAEVFRYRRLEREEKKPHAIEPAQTTR